MDYLSSLKKWQAWILALLVLVLVYALAWWLEWPMPSPWFRFTPVMIIFGLLAIDIAKWAYAKFARNK